MVERHVDAGQLTALCEAVLIAAQMPPDDASLTAKAIVEADLRGVPSHGAHLLPSYIDRIRGGGINPRANVRITQEGPAFALVDGDHGIGHVVATKAMDLAIAKARNCGIGVCSAAHSNHFGIAAYYTLQAAAQGMIGLATTNSVAVIPPPGGRGGLVGNTATSYALPALEEPPLVLDIAMSAAARTKIMLYADRDEPIPDGWAVDKDGMPTNDPHEALKGWLLPIAGHKGFGLALLWDALTGILSGSRFGTQVVRATPTEHFDIGHFVLALDVSQFGDEMVFRQKIDTVIRGIRSAPRKPGVDQIYAPGDRSMANRQRYLEIGVPLPTTAIEQLNRLASEAAIDLQLIPKDAPTDG